MRVSDVTYAGALGPAAIIGTGDASVTLRVMELRREALEAMEFRDAARMDVRRDSFCSATCFACSKAALMRSSTCSSFARRARIFSSRRYFTSTTWQRVIRWKHHMDKVSRGDDSNRVRDEMSASSPKHADK